MTRSLPVQSGDMAPVYVGPFTVQATVLSDLEDAPFTLVLDGVEYSYIRSVPVKGHGASLLPLLEQYHSESRGVILGERQKRYFIYATPALTPAAAAGQ